MVVAEETKLCTLQRVRNTRTSKSARYVHIFGLFLPILVFHNLSQLLEISVLNRPFVLMQRDDGETKLAVGWDVRQRQTTTTTPTTTNTAAVWTDEAEHSPSLTMTVTVPVSFNNNNDKRKSNSVLIAQYSSCEDHDSYSTILLNATSPVNQAYAMHWGHDYILLKGAPNIPPNDDVVVGDNSNNNNSIKDDDSSYSLIQLVANGTRVHQELGGSCDSASAMNNAGRPPSSRSTYNKVALLSIAMAHPQFQNRFDRLLILDADAMMYDFDRDIGQWETNRSFVLAAHKTNNQEPSGTGSINVGVTLWNLQHPLTPFIVKRWKEDCTWRILHQRPDDDQAPLQTLLKEELDDTKRHQVVYAVRGEFEYGRGTFIRHVIRRHNTSWNSSASSIDARLVKIHTNIEGICLRRRSLFVESFPFCPTPS